MGFGKINVWIRERERCSVASINGSITVAQCCGKVILEDKITAGHGEMTVPPGCYIVTAHFKGAKNPYESMVIVNCDKSACINFLLEKGLTG
jgi:hypothetical protein